MKQLFSQEWKSSVDQAPASKDSKDSSARGQMHQCFSTVLYLCLGCALNDNLQDRQYMCAGS